MTRTDISALVVALVAASSTKRGALRARKGMMKAMKDAAADFGPTVPVGDGNAKTDAPGTYRPVGRTCPSSCRFLGNGCYAQSGNVGIHQGRASTEIDAAIIGAAVAMVHARLTGRVARLHVSGDFGQDRINLGYVVQLNSLADAVNRATGQPFGTVVAWSYTHHAVSPDSSGLRAMARHGIMVRVSDLAGPGGAIVHPFADVPRLRQETGLRLAKCPAQLVESTTCASCTLCWTRPDVGIVFDPHGSGKRAATEAAAQ